MKILMLDRLQSFIQSATVKTLFITEADHISQKHIKEVRVCFLVHDKQDTDILTRDEIIILLRNKIDIWTVRLNDPRMADPIRPQFDKIIIFPLDGEDYIRIKSDADEYPTLGDILGYVPRIIRNTGLCCPHCNRNIIDFSRD